MFFGDQTLQAPKTFSHNHIHEVTEFFIVFPIYFKIIVYYVGASKLGAATVFPRNKHKQDIGYYLLGEPKPG